MCNQCTGWEKEMEIVNDAPEAKNWSVEWTGPRGGKWTTGEVTEEQARKKFTQIGESGPAKLLKITVKGTLFGAMREVVEENNTEKLRWEKFLLKDHLQKRAKLDKTIEYNRKIIKELQAKLRAAK
jgi:hypothetical protein